MPITKINYTTQPLAVEAETTIDSHCVEISVDSDRIFLALLADPSPHNKISDATSLAGGQSHILFALNESRPQIQLLNALSASTPQPDLLIIDGDLYPPVGISVPSSETDEQNLEKILSIYAKRLKCPIALTLGNHDLAFARFGPNNYELGQAKSKELVAWAARQNESTEQSQARRPWIFPNPYYLMDIHFKSGEIARLVVINSTSFPQDPQQLLWFKAIIDECDHSPHIRTCALFSHHAIGEAPGKRIYHAEEKKYDLPEDNLYEVSARSLPEKAERLDRLAALFKRRNLSPLYPKGISHHKLLEYMIRDVLQINLYEKCKLIGVGHDHIGYVIPHFSSKGLIDSITVNPGSGGDSSKEAKRLPPFTEYISTRPEKGYSFATITLGPSKPLTIDVYPINPETGLALSDTSSYHLEHGILYLSRSLELPLALITVNRLLFQEYLKAFDTGNIWLINCSLAIFSNFQSENETIQAQVNRFFHLNDLSSETTQSQGIQDFRFFYRWDQCSLLKHFRALYQGIIDGLEACTLEPINRKKEGFSATLAVLELTLRLVIRSLEHHSAQPNWLLPQTAQEVREVLGIPQPTTLFIQPNPSTASLLSAAQDLDEEKQNRLRSIAYNAALDYQDASLEAGERLCQISLDDHVRKFIGIYRSILFSFLSLGSQDARLATQALLRSDSRELKILMTSSLAKHVMEPSVTPLPFLPVDADIARVKANYYRANQVKISTPSAKEMIVTDYFMSRTDSPLDPYLDERNIEKVVKQPVLRMQLLGFLSKKRIPYLPQIDALFELIDRLIDQDRSTYRRHYDALLQIYLSTLFISREYRNPEPVDSLDRYASAFNSALKRSDFLTEVLYKKPHSEIAHRFTELRSYFSDLQNQPEGDSAFRAIRNHLVAFNSTVKRWFKQNSQEYPFILFDTKTSPDDGSPQSVKQPVPPKSCCLM